MHEVVARKLIPIGLCVLHILAGIANVAAQTIDPHKLYEKRCARCHAPHAGDFVHESLVQSGDEVKGRKTSIELRRFLSKGHGKLSLKEIDAMVSHLIAIQKSGRLFHNKCRKCHDRAVVLARTKLIVKNGRLIGRYSNRKIDEFLTHHGRLTPDEVSKMVSVLKRQSDTAEN
jgi:cytochrome c5